MKKLLAYCLLLIGGLSVGHAEGPSYIAIEAHSGKVLFSQSAETRRPITSLSQVATALVTLDWIERTRVGFNQLITVPQEAYAINNVGKNPMGLRPGDRLTLRDALYSTLLGADNVSALTIASYVGRDLSYRRGGGEPVGLFVKEMNNLASGLGMKRTRFNSPHGVDAKGSISESCAVDMALLGSYAMQNAALSFIVKQANRTIRVDTMSGGPKVYTVKNTNTLLTHPGIEGIKTGISNAAGPCLLISATRNALPRKDPMTGTESIFPQRLIVVVLGSQERYVIAQSLIREGWRAWDGWFAAGMPRQDAKEFLSLPRPKQPKTH